VISVASLHVYPVKSCRGTALDRATFTPTGVKHDREWMVVTPAGRFLTQREVPRLALIAPALTNGGLTLSAPGMPTLGVDGADDSGEPKEVSVWRDRCLARDAGDEAARWLSVFLGRSVRLVRFDPARSRPTEPEWSGDTPGFSQFSDGYPVLVLSLASLADLNARLPAPLPRDRFRASVWLEGCEPYEEDALGTIDLVGVRLRLVKPCTRCVITSTNQQTAEVEGDEPLATLRTYRWNSELRGVEFGQNAIVIEGAGRVVEVGDPVRRVDGA
jgi:uncharacterized protein YcbX